jgi:hypothetical protein
MVDGADFTLVAHGDIAIERFRVWGLGFGVWGLGFRVYEHG